MSELRKQLGAEKRDYQSARYPGDLASELLNAPSHRQTILKIVTAGVAISGIAAALVFWITAQRATSPAQSNTPIAVAPKPVSPTTLPPTLVNPQIGTPTVIANATTQPGEEDANLPSMTELAAVSFPIESPVASSSTATTEPADTQFAPSFQSMEIGSMPSMPSMPSMDLSSTETEISKEST
jgi:hypothetical protein